LNTVWLLAAFILRAVASVRLSSGDRGLSNTVFLSSPTAMAKSHGEQDQPFDGILKMADKNLAFILANDLRVSRCGFSPR
jgi:hypothetical protein